LFFLVSSFFYAIAHGALIYFVLYRLIAGGDLLITSFLNLIYIVLGLFLTDKARKYAIAKKSEIKKVYDEEFGPIGKKLYASTQITFRTTMYIFYIGILILSRLSALESNPIPFNLGDFFHSLEYGLLILIAYDNVKVLLEKDLQWFDENFGS